MLDKKRSKITKLTTTSAARSNAKSKAKMKTKASRPQSKPSARLDSELDTTAKATSPTPQRPTSTTMAITPAPLPDLKGLASSVPTLRRQCLHTVTIHLHSHSITATQAAQLWRALYVSLYLHDSKSAISVQNHARALAETLQIFVKLDISPSGDDGMGSEAEESAALWHGTARWADAFWLEMSREWAGLDQWRINKVLMLVRFFVGETIRLALQTAGVEVATNAADAERAELQDERQDQWQDLVAEVVALPLELSRTLPDGLRIHVLDCWSDELEALRTASALDSDASRDDEVRTELANMLVQAVKELSVFRQGEVNLPKNVRTRAKEVVAAHTNA
jgi:hypothetical protein